MFEATGEGDLSGVEVRLSSSADPLMVLPARSDARLFLQSERYHLYFMLSPWPVRRRFKTLRLRRVSVAEEFAILASGAGRLITHDKPFQRAAHVAKRLLAGQALGIQLSGEPAFQTGSLSRPETTAASGHLTIAGKGCSAVIAKGDRLLPRAFALVEQEFARLPDVQAIYADCREGDIITPRPQWDDILAQHADFAGAPAFFRSGEAETIAPWQRLSDIAREKGAAAIHRLALPLVERDSAPDVAIKRPPIPSLSRTPLVSVVIPTKYQVALLGKCLAGLAEATGYPDIEVVIVDNGCEDPRFPSMLEAAGRSLKILRVEDRGGFNFPRLIDAGVKVSSGEIVLLLNDDIEPVEAGWLHRMVASALEPGAGAVGARLVYPSGDIQHAGVMLGLGGVCGHLWKGATPDQAASNAQISLPSRRSAVTGACLAVRRQLYDAAGGLDTALAVAFNDIDFCLRLNALGHGTIYRGDAVLIHHESQSRGPDDASVGSRRRLASETHIFLARWREATLDDPFGSPAFNRLTESGAIHSELLTEWPTD